MKLFDGSMIVIATIVAVCALAGFVSSLWLGNDNPIEQAAEKVIEEETGISVDLSSE